ncbi:MAG: hypothetical protein P8M22_03295 [Phycisphaerales bacterium]|nr:hypothetical protein [Phycisphaerales bacterium]
MHTSTAPAFSKALKPVKMKPASGWISVSWRFFLVIALCSLLAGTIASLTLIWAGWQSGVALQAMGTTTTFLFGASMGLLVTYMCTSTCNRRTTQLAYVFALSLILLSTFVCIQAIWFKVGIYVPIRALGTSFVLFPATLGLLKLTTMFQGHSPSEA